MKSNALFNKTIYLMAIIGLIGLSTNTAFSQKVKKKIVRVIEVDDKGERVVKEFDVSNDAAKIDSITRDVHKKIKIERIKMDSLEHILMINLPKHFELPPLPDMPDMPDFDFEIPKEPFFGLENDFDFFPPDSLGLPSKIYYSEKGFDNNENLSKILEDLEKGTFDPKKWNLKEVEKDKIKDFKTNGKGEVLIFGNPPIAPPHFQYFNRTPHRNMLRYKIERDDVRGGRDRHRMLYYDSDSLNKNDFEDYSFNLLGDSDNGECENVIVVTSDGRKHNISKSERKEKKMIVFVNDGKTTKFEFSKPSMEDMNTLEKSDLMKEDKTKQLSPESLTLFPTKEKDKYSIRFREDESGKVKVIITDNKGKTIKTEEFDHSNRRTEKVVEIKDFKSGIYFIQAQLNGKTITVKLEVKID